MKTLKWKDKVIYQIFPRSYYDYNNDGSGDIKGIIKKIPYLKQLGIDAIWLCPTYDTEFADAGYDVKDYKSVWKQFGTLEDFQEMTNIAQNNGIDIIMDIVLNHVSSDHPWFIKALESTKNIEHNYFIWRDELTPDEEIAKSIFGGSAWEYVPSLKKYYFHLFAKEQVDLNWEHPDTIEAMADVIDFWYNIGVKGFRLDAIKHISKIFPEGTTNDFSWGPTTIPQLQKFNKRAFSNKPDAFIFGEASGITKAEALKYGVGESKVSSNYFNFSWWWIGWGKETGRNGFDPNWDYKDFAKQMIPFQNTKEISPELMSNFLTNHDTSRAVSRWGDENVFWKESAKSFALYQFVLKGIPVIYYGDEIGMLNPRFENRSEFRDVDALNSYKEFVDEKQIYTEDEMTKYHNINSRDNSRTPMQWDSTINAGFNDGAQPWIKLGFNWKVINVEKQLNQPNSILNFYKKLIQLRKTSEYKNILIDGESLLELLDNGIFKVTRTYNDEKIVAFINITSNSKDVELPKNGKVILSSWDDKEVYTRKLRSYESILLKII